MLKKKKQKILFLKKRNKKLIRILSNIFLHNSFADGYKDNNLFVRYNTMLSIFTPKKQMYFYFHNRALTFNKIFSVGVFFSQYIKFFKFFKKSLTHLNPLLLLFKYRFLMELENMFIMYIKNFCKKHYIFLKKFFHYIKTKIRFLVLTRSWNYIGRPRKRIKKKTYKLVMGML